MGKRLAPEIERFRIEVAVKMAADGKTYKEIGDVIGLPKNQSRKFLLSRGVKTLTVLALEKGRALSHMRAIQEDEAVELYVNQKLSSREIAKLKNCSKVAILNCLNKYKIEIRTSQEGQLIKHEKNPGMSGFKKGSMNPGWNKTPPCSENKGHSISYNGVVFKSSFEAAFAYWCDQNNKEWKYEPERFNLFNRITYAPDFLVDGEWVEIKGWLTDRGALAINLFRESGQRLTVLTKPDLIKMGVLSKGVSVWQCPQLQ